MSDQVIAEIERSVEDFSQRLDAGVLLIYGGNALWIVSCHMRSIRCQSESVMEALRQFEVKVRAYEARDVALAQTLGLEAAE